MNSIAQRSRSLWMEELPQAAPPLQSAASIDTVIVGAGIAGLTTAYLLARAGRQVLVVDSGPPGGGMTGRTTAHLSNALDDRWHHMIALRGVEDATIAAAGHTAAIDQIEAIQREAGIDCDFARLDGYLFAGPDDSEDTLRKELEACHRVGLNGVTLEPAGPIAWTPSAALRFPNQARFHPLKYLKGLIAAVERHGGQLATGHVSSIAEDQQIAVTVEGGARITATNLVVATNVPINDKVTIHTKQAPYRSYVIAGRVERGAIPDALIWDNASPYHYVRLQPDGDSDILIVGGEDHKTGQAHDMDQRLARLEQWALQHFPALREIEWRWSGQVMETMDGLGFLGRNPGSGDNVFVITGDSGQGMTHGTLGGMIVSDLILDRDNRFAELFDAGRRTLKALPTYAKENLNVAGEMMQHLSAGEVSSVDQIAPGSGAVMRRGMHKVAVYKSRYSTIVERSAVCPHVGCIVAWNPMEGCWDCPCHGSQFAADGAVLNGPSKAGLAELKD